MESEFIDSFDNSNDDAQLTVSLTKSLDDVSNELLTRIDVNQDEFRATSWDRARKVVEAFRPVPWFIWRMVYYVFVSGESKRLSEGFFFGLNNFLLTVASDSVLGEGRKIEDVHEAYDAVNDDILGACAVIYSICRRLKTKNFERIWKPMLDDAILRARIGYMIGVVDLDFGCGRGMLAGFAGRIGLVVLIATGSLEQAKETLDLLTYGSDISDVGLRIYGCEPLQVSSMLLSACGCGRSAAFGTAGFCVSGVSNLSSTSDEDIEEKKWKAAFAICEAIRKQQTSEGNDESWEMLGFNNRIQRTKFAETAKTIVRTGHKWEWLIDG